MKRTIPLLLLALTASCNLEVVDRRARLQDGLLQQASAEDRAAVNDARLAWLETKDTAAAAQLELETARGGRRELLIQRDRTRAELQEAERALKAEREKIRPLGSGESYVIPSIDAHLEAAAVTERSLALHDARIESLEEQVEFTRSQEKLAAAHVDVLKARAILGLERTDTDNIDLPALERRARECATEVSLAATRLEAAQREVQILETTR